MPKNRKISNEDVLKNWEKKRYDYPKNFESIIKNK